MIRRRRNSVAPAELMAEMDRVYAGALAIIAHHRPAKGTETTLPPTNATPPTNAAPAAHRVAPPAGRIGLQTRFQSVQGRTRITPNSLRARALAATPCSLADLAALLGGEGVARGVVGKLRAAGWLEIVSPD